MSASLALARSRLTCGNWPCRNSRLCAASADVRCTFCCTYKAEILLRIFTALAASVLARARRIMPDSLPCSEISSAS
ncbi:hypothetical protein D3C76_1417500 [compost metagenome]